MKNLFYIIIVFGLLFLVLFQGESNFSTDKNINYTFSEAKKKVKGAGFVILDSKTVDNGFSFVSYLFYVRVGSSFCVQEFRSNSSDIKLYSQDCGISESFWKSL